MIYIDNGSQGISSDENESSSYVLPDQIDSVKHLMHDEEGMIVVGDDDSVLSTACSWNSVIDIDKIELSAIASGATFLPGGGEQFKLEDETVGDQFVMVPPNMAEGPGMLYDQLENENSAKDTGSAEISSEENGVLSQYMDIQEPLSSLKILLENRLKIDLTGCTYWLQDTQLLEADRNLVEQCVHGEGLVQINYQVKMENGKFKINIVDVLKPAEEYVEISPEVSTRIEENDDKSEAERPDMVRWIIDSNFRKEQERLNIPQDPKDWSKAQVRHWLLWAVRQFNLTKIQLPDWDITGEELVQITLDDFRKKVPLDPNDHFWTHLELLRKCKFSAIIAKKNDSEEAEGRKVTSIENVSPPAFDQTERLSVIEKKANLSAESEKEEKSPSKKIPRALGSIKQKGCIRISKSKSNKILFVQEMNTASGKTGNNGQIQLWQFLLDLLTDKRHRQSIQWQGEDGEFKLIDPEVVANLWGERKNKPTMNYEKLSRALRYYYEGDMISKVQGKRFVYKFVCDLKALLGYSAAKLNKLVIEAELNARSNDSNVGVDELMEMQF